ncbi:MAG: Gmad2 immunoglobulin-like domain-containing protein [Candidatus Gracilibacteria bacterium]|jgi:hypothetical protein
MLKSRVLGIIATVGIFVSLTACTIVLTGEDTWLCQDGAWVKHGNPSALQPTEECKKDDAQPQNPTQTPNQAQDQTPNPTPANDLQDLIKVTTPEANALIKSPLEIVGEARGPWYFEGVFPVKLLDGNENIIAEGQATAQDEWMTENFVPFKATLTFRTPTTETGTLVLSRDNPSALPENDASISIPIKFDRTTSPAGTGSITSPATETLTVKAFFGNTKIDPNVRFCERTYAVTRTIPKTKSVAREAILELLKGVSATEKAKGFVTQLNEGIQIQKLVIKNGVASIDFNQALQEKVGGSCRVATIRSQITQTLKQFSSVQSVIISIDGESETILQP